MENNNIEVELQKKQRIVLFGGGNQVHYTIDIINKQNLYQVIGIIDSVKEIGSDCHGFPVIGRQTNLKQLIIEHSIHGGLITIGDNYSRELVYKDIVIQVPDFMFINAIHPSVSIGQYAMIGKGVVAMAGVIINPRAFIGDFTFFATGAQVEHDCVIGDFASISAGSIMGGYVKIGRLSAITLGVVLLDRIEIGENTVVGSGSLVLKSLPSNVLAHGHPINKVRARQLGEKYLK